MKVVIASTDNKINTPVDPHFGRCKWFCLFESSDRTYYFIENDFSHKTEHAGIQAAEFLHKEGVGIAVAGRFGAKVAEVFRNNHIQMIIPENTLTISDIINKIK